jgi:hypothetical protein
LLEWKLEREKIMAKYVPPLGVRTFLELDDTPDSYSGKGGRVVKVKSTEDGLTFGFPDPFSAWSYRKKITIAGSSGAGVNYTVPLNVGESSGATGYNFHIEGHSANFPIDLRFTKDDGITLLNCWVESITGTSPNRTAKIWVKISDDLGVNRNIYCYYGNPNATNVSNGPNTFPFFEDFNSYSDGYLNGKGGWSGDTYFNVQGTTVYEGAKAVQVSGGPANTWIQVKKPLTTNLNSVEVRVYLRAAQTNLNTGYIWILNTAGALIGGGAMSSAAYFQVQGGTSANDGTYAANTWYLAILQIRETNQYVRFEGGGAAFTAWIAPANTGTPGYVQLLSYSQNAICYWDLIIVRNFITVEPAFSSAGSEETS